MFGKLILTAAVAVFIIDLSGWRDTMHAVASALTGRRVTSLRPLDCSLCMAWWAGLVVVLVEGITFAGVAECALCALLTRPMAELAGALLDLVARIVRRIDNTLK